MSLYTPPPKGPIAYVVRKVPDTTKEEYYIYSAEHVHHPHHRKYSPRGVVSFARGHREDTFDCTTVTESLVELIKAAQREPTFKEKQQRKPAGSNSQPTPSLAE
jgi:hypothetical protein